METCECIICRNETTGNSKESVYCSDCWRLYERIAEYFLPMRGRVANALGIMAQVCDDIGHQEIERHNRSIGNEWKSWGADIRGLTEER